MSDASNRNRQPRGIPAGGEFAANSHDEAEGSLAAPGRRRRDLTAKRNLSDAELLAEVRRAVDVYGSRKDLDFHAKEEAVSEVLAELYESYGSKGKPIDGALVNHVARLRVAKTLNSGVKPLLGSTAMAHTMFGKRVEELEGQLGRELSSKEKDRLADDIRDNWTDAKGNPDPQHKPTEGFHRFHTEHARIDMPGDGESEGTGYINHPDLIDPYSPEAQIANANPAAEEALEQVLDRGAAAKRESRERIWDLVAVSAYGAPEPKANLTAAQANTLSACVRSHGGALAAVERFERGEDDHPSVRALMMPFREPVTQGGRSGFRRLKPAEEQAVADAIRAHSGFADEMFASALASAKRTAANARARN